MGADSSKLLQEHFRRLQNDPAYNNNPEQQEDFLKKIFSRLDSDKNGFIDRKEMKGMIRSLAMSCKAVNGVSLSVPEVLNYISSSDANNDGKLTFNEFVVMIKHISNEKINA